MSSQNLGLRRPCGKGRDGTEGRGNDMELSICSAGSKRMCSCGFMGGPKGKLSGERGDGVVHRNPSKLAGGSVRRMGPGWLGEGRCLAVLLPLGEGRSGE